MIYIILAAAVLLIFIIFVVKKNLNNGKKVNKQIEELTNKINKDKDDHASVFQLAKLKEEMGETESALEMYEKLLSLSFYEKKEELEVCKKLEEFYEKLGENEKAFKYTLKISKLDSNNMFYNIKAADILCNEGYYMLSSDYFNKAMLNKNEFNIDNLKAASFTFFKIKDYKKCIVFLEELQKRLAKEKNDDIALLNRTLISMYIISDELNIAKSFIEHLIADKNTDDKLYIDRLYLHILYKILDNEEEFKGIYDNLYAKYDVANPNEKIFDLVLDYSFYSYFLSDIELSLKLFETINNLNLPEFDIYNIENLIKYLLEINEHQKKLKPYNSKNDNYEKYINKEDIENWEKAVDLWEGSFTDINYLISLIKSENTINIQKILDELKIQENNNSNEMNLKIIQKVDKIYNMNIADFKKLCSNLIRTKLHHSIIQEYDDSSSKNDYGDEVNYLTYNTKGNKKDTVLISFKRWKKIEIGELIIRDFIMMVNEAGAKNGILIVPVKLNNSARNYISYNDKVTVYSRNQFNNLLKEEKL